MLSSRQGSPDGRRVQWYIEGRTYEVTESLAAIFLKEGWAQDADLPRLEQSKAEMAAAHKQEYSIASGNAHDNRRNGRRADRSPQKSS